MTTPNQRSQRGGAQFWTVIPKRDLYRLVMRSKRPEAERFEDWVVGEVLPSIRKHGYYATAGSQSCAEAARQEHPEFADRHPIIPTPLMRTHAWSWRPSQSRLCRGCGQV